MSELPADNRRDDELTEDELAGETGEALPDRAALSSIDADVAIPLNPALAADVLAGGSGEEPVEPQEPDDDQGEEGR